MGLANGSNRNRPTFSLILNVVLSGVLEFGASLTPKPPKGKVGGRYAIDLFLQLPALPVRFRRISEQRPYPHPRKRALGYLKELQNKKTAESGPSVALIEAVGPAKRNDARAPTAIFLSCLILRRPTNRPKMSF